MASWKVAESDLERGGIPCPKATKIALRMASWNVAESDLEKGGIPCPKATCLGQRQQQECSMTNSSGRSSWVVFMIPHLLG